MFPFFTETLFKGMLGAVLGLMLVLTSLAPGQATLIGDTVTCSTSGLGLGNFQCNPTNAVVTDPGSEFTLVFNDFLDSLDINIGAETIRIDVLATIINLSRELNPLSLSDLDWVNGPPSSIVGFSFNTTIPGLNSERLSFTVDSFHINLERLDFREGEFLEINLDVAPIPEPSTVLLFGSGLAGLAVWRYRKAMSPRHC